MFWLGDFPIFRPPFGILPYDEIRSEHGRGIGGAIVGIKGIDGMDDEVNFEHYTRYLTVGEAAKILNRSDRSVRVLLKQGLLRGINPTGRKWLIPAEEIDLFLGAGTAEHGGPDHLLRSLTESQRELLSQMFRDLKRVFADYSIPNSIEGVLLPSDRLLKFVLKLQHRTSEEENTVDDLYANVVLDQATQIGDPTRVSLSIEQEPQFQALMRRLTSTDFRYAYQKFGENLLQHIQTCLYWYDSVARLAAQFISLGRENRADSPSVTPIIVQQWRAVSIIFACDLLIQGVQAGERTPDTLQLALGVQSLREKYEVSLVEWYASLRSQIATEELLRPLANTASGSERAFSYLDPVLVTYGSVHEHARILFGIISGHISGLSHSVS